MHPLFQEKKRIACWESHNKCEERGHKYGVGIHTDMLFLEQKEHQSVTEQETQVSDVHLLAHLKDD